MKKYLFIVYFSMVGFSAMAAGRTINEKLLLVFRETYPNAVQVSWMEYPETYTVYFVEQGIRSTIIFNKDGTFVRSTRYYQEEFLPYYLVAAIREKYHEKKIYSITEVSSPNNVEYFVKLVDDKYWMTLKLDSEGNIRILEKFRKA
jgi:hypothetical protein